MDLRGPLSAFPAKTNPDKISKRFSLYFLSETIRFYSQNKHVRNYQNVFYFNFLNLTLAD